MEVSGRTDSPVAICACMAAGCQIIALTAESWSDKRIENAKHEPHQWCVVGSVCRLL